MLTRVVVHEFVVVPPHAPRSAKDHSQAEHGGAGRGIQIGPRRVGLGEAVHMERMGLPTHKFEVFRVETGGVPVPTTVQR